MRLITDSLYRQIIEKEAPISTALRVISGYGSPQFLGKVVKAFPHLNIVLYLGMTPYGISMKDHLGFKDLVRQRHNEKIEVYYQVEGIPNHMKVMEFISSSGKSAYVGSANFSENGFFNHREAMVNAKVYTDSLFSYQHSLSLPCIDEDIENNVMIYPDRPEMEGHQEEFLDRESMDDEKPANSHSLVIEDDGKYEKNPKTESLHHHKFLQLRNNISPEYYNKFELEIVLDANQNRRWANTGINAWVDGKEPNLMQTPRWLFDKIFPVGKIFEIYSDDGQKLSATLSGRFNGELKFMGTNIYEYIRNRIGIREKRPISRDDLIEYGNTVLHFERINETEYLMSFGLPK